MSTTDLRPRRRPLVAVLLLALLVPATAAAQDEPGAATQVTDPLGVAERNCRAGVPCPQLPALLRLVHDVDRGPRALLLLGRLGDMRAVSAVAQAAAYGATAAIKRVAQQALADLARAPATKAAVQRLAARDPDAAVRAVAAQATGGRAGAAGRTAPAKPAKETRAAKAKRQQKRMATQPQRVVYGATALSREPGSMAWTVYNLGFHTYDWAINEHLEVGLGVMLPIAIYTVAPRIKLAFHPHRLVHIGVTAMGGVAGTYVGGGGGVAFFAGGPVVTIGHEKLLLNIGFLAAVGGPFGELDGDVGWAMAPSLGFSWQVHRIIRINLELYTPFVGDDDFPHGRVWAILYGIRISGEHLFGDVSFVIPAFDGAEEFLRYVPLGFPLLTFGYQW